MDVGGEGHAAKNGKLGLVGKGKHAYAIVAPFYDVGDNCSAAVPILTRQHRQPGAHSHAFGGTDESLPCVWTQTVQKQYFELSSSLFTGLKAGRDNAGVVEDEDVAGVQVFRKLVKTAMLHRIEIPVQHHQSRVVSWFDRSLGNELGRQRVVEIARLHLPGFNLIDQGGKVLYPLHHVRVGHEKLGQIGAKADTHLFLSQVHEIVVGDDALLPTVDL